MTMKISGPDEPIRGLLVVGTGRSGTHFSTRLLSGFSRVHDPLGGMENNQLLHRLARAAILHEKIGTQEDAYYRRLFGGGVGLIPLDQHHPNLFFLEDYFFRIGNVVAIYPQRPIVQIVASMMKHEGVQYWYEFIRSQGRGTSGRIFPNQFLGLQDVLMIDRLPRHLLFAHRVVAHRRKFEELREKFPGRIRCIGYESLVVDPEAEIRKCFSDPELRQLGSFSLGETPEPSSLVKYLDVLSARQVDEILALENSEFPA